MVKIIFQQIVKKELYVKSCVYRKVMMQIYLWEGVIHRSSGGAWVPNEGGSYDNFLWKSMNSSRFTVHLVLIFIDQGGHGHP